MASGPYLVLLFLGVLIVIVDGQFIMRNSPAYLAQVYGTRPARKLASLVAVFFHLVMLGLVALVAAFGLGPDPTVQTLISRIGVILLLTALGHALTMSILSRLRTEQESTEIAEAQLARQQEVMARGKSSTPSARGGAPREERSGNFRRSRRSDPRR
jgi:fatty acid desaturase